VVNREYVVNSVLKALDILELLDDKSELGITQIARTFDMEKSTVYRLVNSLRIRGYVQQNPDNQKYSNGFKLFEMGNNVVKHMGMRKQAYPFLKELSEKTGEAVNLAIRDEKYVVYLDKIESQSTIRVDLAVGKKMPMYCTGLGKAILAFLPQEKVEELLRGEVFEQFTSHTHRDLKSLTEELIEIRNQGFAWDHEEYVEGLICVAAPVFGLGGKVVAAMSTALPKYYVSEDEQEKAKDHVVEVAQKLTKALSGAL
jgi:IclR family KDG regulon transcriptional repressor